MSQLKAAQFEHDPILGHDLLQIAQQAAADIPAEPGSQSAGSQGRVKHRAGGRFSVRPCDADHAGRAIAQEYLDFAGEPGAGATSDLQTGVLRRDGRIDDDEFRVAKIGSVVAAELNGLDRHVGQLAQ